MKKFIFCAGMLACVTISLHAINLGFKKTLTVISYNIRMATPQDGENQWDVRKPATVRMIRESSPDFVAMQEVLPEQERYLKENFPGYLFIGAGRDDGENEGERMTIMIKKDRFYLQRYGHFWLSETPSEPSRGWDGACNRMVTWIQVKERGTDKELFLFNTHLDHVGEQARLESVSLMMERIADIAGKDPVIITGDFNAEIGDPLFKPLSKWRDARGTAKESDSKHTFNGWGDPSANQVIDHIFTRKLKAESFRTLDGDYGVPFISDHYPIEAVLLF